MTIDEIRRNAPDRATHYIDCGDAVKYYMHFYFGFGWDYVFDGISWSKCIINLDELEPL